MPCCGRLPFEVMSDRMTLDVALVTCDRRPEVAAAIVAARADERARWSPPQPVTPGHASLCPCARCYDGPRK